MVRRLRLAILGSEELIKRLPCQRSRGFSERKKTETKEKIQCKREVRVSSIPPIKAEFGSTFALREMLKTN